MPVDQLTQKLRELVLERQSLRERGAATDDLERNRLEIVRVQWELSQALIEAHAAQRRVRASGPVEGVRGNREVPPATTTMHLGRLQRAA